MVALTSASRSNLIHWTDNDVIAADLEGAGGPGRHRRFSALNVIEVELAATIARFKVPIATIAGALGVFRGWHRQMRAIHEVVMDAPLASGTQPGLFGSIDERHQAAHGAIKSRAYDAAQSDNRRPLLITPDGVAAARAHVTEMARVWDSLRTMTSSEGRLLPADVRERFLGLFIGGPDERGDSAFAVVALDPPRLNVVIEGSAIVIDLAGVVFRVHERSRALGGRGRLTQW